MQHIRRITVIDPTTFAERIPSIPAMQNIRSIATEQEIHFARKNFLH